MKELRLNLIDISSNKLPTQPPSDSTTMPQHHSLASDMVELDKLFGMTADAIEVR